MRYPIYKQDSAFSCGAYCIQMILRYYHCKEEIKTIKEKSRMTNQGISVYGMIQCLKDYHIEAKAYQCDFQTLLEQVKGPCILHTIEDNMLHYIVLYQIKKGICIIGDPAKGLVKLEESQLKQKYTGVCIVIEHVGRYRNDLSYCSFLQFCLNHVRKHYRQIIKVVIFSLLFAFFNIFSSFYFQFLIDHIEKESLWIIFLFTFLFFIATVIKIIIHYVRQNYILTLKKELDYEYVLRPLKSMMYLPLHYFQINEAGVIFTKIEHLSSLSEFFLQSYITLFMDVTLILSIYLVLFMLQPQIAYFILFMILLLFIIVIRYMKRLTILNKEVLKKDQMHHKTILECLDNMVVSSLFTMKRFMKQKLTYFYLEFLDTAMQKDQLTNHIQTVMDGVLQTSLFFILFVCSMKYKDGTFTIGDIILYYMLISYLIQPFFHFIQLWIQKDEIQIIFDQYKDMLPLKQKKKKKLKQKIRKISFCNVTYSYGYTKPILEHCNVTIQKSTMIKGDIGTGKTTLCHLLMGFDKPVKGSIRINDMDLNEIDLTSLYQHMLYLDKQPIFYQESLRFNMLLERNDLEQEMMALLQRFQLDDLLVRLDEMLDEKGGFLSSGQQQIVMLIRALLKHSDVLILDEALSNVDEKKVIEIFSYLKSLPILLILVSHQINVVNDDFGCVIINADKTVSEVTYAS